jgi:hypothetical protein
VRSQVFSRIPAARTAICEPQQADDQQHLGLESICQLSGHDRHDAHHHGGWQKKQAGLKWGVVKDALQHNGKDEIGASDPKLLMILGIAMFRTPMFRATVSAPSNTPLVPHQ